MTLDRTTLVLFGLLCASCAAERVKRPPPPPVDWASLQAGSAPDAGIAKATQKERAVADLYVKALSAPSTAQLSTLVDEDAHFSFGSIDTRGRDRLIKAHDLIFGAFDQRSFLLSRVFRTDRSQALEWAMTGVQTRPWMGIAASMRPVAIKGLTLLWTTDDGSVSDVHLYLDVAVVKAELGVGLAELKSLAPAPPPRGAAQVFEQSGVPEEDANVALVRAMLQALEDNRESAYVSTLASEVEVFTLDHAQPSRGKGGCERLFRTLRKSIGDLDTVVQNAWGIEQFAIVEYSISGLQLAPLGRIPFTPNRLVHLQIVDIAEVHAGKITRIWRYDDSGALAAP